MWRFDREAQHACFDNRAIGFGGEVDSYGHGRNSVTPEQVGLLIYSIFSILLITITHNDYNSIFSFLPIELLDVSLIHILLMKIIRPLGSIMLLDEDCPMRSPEVSVNAPKTTDDSFRILSELYQRATYFAFLGLTVTECFYERVSIRLLYRMILAHYFDLE